MNSTELLKEHTNPGNEPAAVAIQHISFPTDVDSFFHLHRHDAFEFVIVLEGAVVYTLEDQEYSAMAGEGLFIHSNRPHAARSHNGLPCEACVILFHPGRFSGSFQGPPFSKYVVPVISGEKEFRIYLVGKEKWQWEVLERLKEIDALKDRNPSDVQVFIQHKLFEIWYLCFQHSLSNPPGRGFAG